MKINLNNDNNKYFKEDENGNYISHHIESTDKAYASFLPSLTIETFLIHPKDFVVSIKEIIF